MYKSTSWGRNECRRWRLCWKCSARCRNQYQLYNNRCKKVDLRNVVNSGLLNKHEWANEIHRHNQHEAFVHQFYKNNSFVWFVNNSILLAFSCRFHFRFHSVWKAPFVCTRVIFSQASGWSFVRSCPDTHSILFITPSDWLMSHLAVVLLRQCTSHTWEVSLQPISAIGKLIKRKSSILGSGPTVTVWCHRLCFFNLLRNSLLLESVFLSHNLKVFQLHVAFNFVGRFVRQNLLCVSVMFLWSEVSQLSKWSKLFQESVKLHHTYSNC